MREPLADRVVRPQHGWLDPAGSAVQAGVGGFYRALGKPGRALKDQMHGVATGHPLHPALTDVPLGAWTVGVVADLAAYATHAVPTQAGDFALLVGTAAAVAAAVTGYTDHHETYGHERDVATLHGLLMTLVVLLEVASLGMRWGGGAALHAPAVALALVALAVALGGAFLGGHLTFGMGTMVNRHAFAPGPEGWTAIGTPADFPEGAPRRVAAGPMGVLAVRLGGRVNAIAAACSHAGGPLDEGSLEGDVVTCPWHGSRFCVRDGAVRGGPATFPQPVLLVRERDGQVEVMPAQAGH